MSELHQAEEQKKWWLLAFVGLVFLTGLAVTLNNIEWVQYRSDVYSRWYATTKLFADGRDLYDLRNGEEAIQFSGFPDPAQAGFFYPAHLILFTGPLALLPYPAAHLIWTVLIQLFYVLALWLAARKVNWPPSANQAALFMIAAVLFLPQLQHTIWGQFNTIGLLSLALAYDALRQERFGLAGIWAVGLTFKPHATLLTLVFLLGWALFDRRRWPFYAGFGATAIVLWAATEFWQPGWLGAFIASLNQYIPVYSVVDQYWNPNQLVAAALLLLVAAFAYYNRQMPAPTAAFTGSLALTMGVWFLVVPVIGMLHVVLLPFILILLLADLQLTLPRLYRVAVVVFSFIYLSGWIGFLWGLSSPAQYGQHIALSELAYKILAPLAVSLFALPLAWRRPEPEVIGER
jgi:hypothetical protein